jgi:hypothetical protein
MAAAMQHPQNARPGDDTPGTVLARLAAASPEPTDRSANQAAGRGAARPSRRIRAVAGYSGTPLPRKLGIGEGTRVAFVDAPPEFAVALGELPAGVAQAPPEEGGLDVIVFFTTSRLALEARFGELGQALQPAGGLWVAWPKKSSGLPTDLTEDVLREVVLPSGLVDNKVCAVDDRWSGLRFVWRKELRAGLAAGRA